MRSVIAWVATLTLVCAAQTSAQELLRQNNDQARGATGSFGSPSSTSGGFATSTTPNGYSGSSFNGQYTVVAKLSEISADKREITVAEPNLAVREGVLAQVGMNGFKAVNLGSGVSLLANGVKVSLPGAENEEELELGRRLSAKVTRIDSHRVRLDLRLQTRDLEAAEQSVRVRTSDVRAIESVELNEMVKIVLAKQDDGSAKSWLEVRVRSGADNGIAGRTLPYPKSPTGSTQRGRYDEPESSIGSRPTYRSR